MRITSFHPIDASLKELGLQSVSLRKLGQLVVLAGPNGGGKSRILRLLQQIATSESQRIQARTRYADRIQGLGRLLDEHAAGRQKVDEVRLKQYRSQLQEAKTGLERLNVIKLDEEVETIRVVSFVPKRLELVDPAALTRGDVLSRAERAKNPGVESMHENALAYIQRAQDRFWEVTHPQYRGGADAKAQVEDDYRRLCELLEALLRTELARSDDSHALIFGKPLGECLLSDGQKVLLQLIVAVHPTHDDEAIVVVMDEPENHLHPSALIGILDRVRAALPHAQFWIATHSVPLLAHLYAGEPDSLHFVESGAVTHAGTKPRLVLEGLLGDEEEQAKLLTFIDLPHSLAALQFAASCLAKPAVAEHQPDDSQITQIRELLLGAKKVGESLKVLDVGAGKGRLLRGLGEEPAIVRSQFDYVAFDASSNDRNTCEKRIARYYDSIENRWYSNLDQLFTGHGEGAFDVVVMCNVLHEIDPEEWLSILGPSGMVGRALREGGSLLIVEDLRIPVGELPHSRGFFLMDTIHLHKLFGVKNPAQDEDFRVADMRNGRLKAHLVPRRLVVRVSSASRNDAITALRETALRELKELRKSRDHSYRSGHLSGLWSQQFSNCCLYLGIDC